MDTGIRVSELTNIKIVDLNFSRCLVTVIGKGQKQRSVPFSNITRKALLKYINNSRENLSVIKSDYLFPAKYGDHISVSSVQQALRRKSKKAGIPSCYPHIFRHTFATMFIANGGPAAVLKEIMGYESIQTTEKYVHLDANDLKKQHQVHSPLMEIFKKP